MSNNESNTVVMQQAANAEAAFLMSPIGQETKKFELIQRKATMLAQSDIVPKDYHGRDKIGNVIIAMEMAERMGVNPIMVMQNLNIIYGRPAWSSKFMIASFNQCGRFMPIDYEFTKGVETFSDEFGCRAFTYAKDDVEKTRRIYGALVTMGMAKAEGWISKNGSKWKTMPELMLRYRAASFLVNTVAPEISMGFMTQEEADDVADTPTYSEVNSNATTEEADPEAMFAPAVEVQSTPASNAQATGEELNLTAE